MKCHDEFSFVIKFVDKIKLGNWHCSHEMKGFFFKFSSGDGRRSVLTGFKHLAWCKPSRKTDPHSLNWRGVRLRDIFWPSCNRIGRIVFLQPIADRETQASRPQLRARVHQCWRSCWTAKKSWTHSSTKKKQGPRKSSRPEMMFQCRPIKTLRDFIDSYIMTRA